MKLYKNIEGAGFRCTLTLENNDKLGHKLLSESEELRDTLTHVLGSIEEPIIDELLIEKQRREIK